MAEVRLGRTLALICTGSYPTTFEPLRILLVMVRQAFQSEDIVKQAVTNGETREVFLQLGNPGFAKKHFWCSVLPVHQFITKELP